MADGSADELEEADGALEALADPLSVGSADALGVGALLLELEGVTKAGCAQGSMTPLAAAAGTAKTGSPQQLTAPARDRAHECDQPADRATVAEGR